MDVLIRNTKTDDYPATENLTREAFWNIYQPGCDEHLVLHNIRKRECYISELDFVLELDGKLIGHIVYTKSIITMSDGNIHNVISFGPVCIDPDYHKTGYGSMIIKHSLNEAKRLGFKSVFITGNPDYYHRFGFVSATKFDIHLSGCSLDDEASYFMVCKLYDDALDGINGIFEFDSCFEADKNELEQFEKNFPVKIKEVREGQFK